LVTARPLEKKRSHTPAVPKRDWAIPGVVRFREIPPTGLGLRGATIHMPVAPPLAPLRMSAANHVLPSSRKIAACRSSWIWSRIRRAWASAPRRFEERDQEVEMLATIAAINPAMSAVIPAATSTSTRVYPRSEPPRGLPGRVLTAI
jgi:hypothetical protein